MAANGIVGIGTWMGESDNGVQNVNVRKCNV